MSRWAKVTDRLIPHNVFVAWSRDGDHKSIHYLNTEVQGSSTSWPDQACKWCTHFPVQTEKNRYSAPKKLKRDENKGQQQTKWTFSCGPLQKKKIFFLPNNVLCINIWWHWKKHNPLLLLAGNWATWEVRTRVQRNVLKQENKTSILIPQIGVDTWHLTGSAWCLEVYNCSQDNVQI